MFSRIAGTYGLSEQFNVEHYQRVREARKEAGLPGPQNMELPAHPLTGQTLRDKHTNECYVVTHVQKAWWKGYYIQALVRKVSTGTEALMVSGVLNCIDPDILSRHHEFEETFEVVFS